MTSKLKKINWYLHLPIWSRDMNAISDYTDSSFLGTKGIIHYEFVPQETGKQALYVFWKIYGSEVIKRTNS
jgi:hypothetical protein